MENLKIKKRLYHQTPLKMLSFLSNHPGEVFSAEEVSRSSKSSRGATNQTLRLLLKLDVLSRERKGNLFLYRLNADNFLLRQFKIFENLLSLQKLVKETQEYCYEIILFGSRADGSNTADSDIDLFIRTEYKTKARKIVNKYRAINENLKAVILDPLEIASSMKTDRVFYNEVKKGIILWEGKPTYEEI
ncbi:MAG: nucleotidyltransferase domain-containing protein [Candidatus Omnitrophica bacterium]|nr:nucleotidyltransferase domain-containing protein [Candidatus Omnitrophota bacterium]